MYLLILLFIIILAYLIDKYDRKQKTDEFELKIINDSFINIFNIDSKQFRKSGHLFFINKFKDFIILSDFNNNAYDINYNIDYLFIRNNYYLINRELLFKISSYKEPLLRIEDRIKTEYMYWYTSKWIKYNKIESNCFDIKNIRKEIEYNRHRGKKYKKWENIREVIINRDNRICVLCGDELEHEDIHIHHIIYKKDGGNDNYTNLVTLCIECHATLPDHDKVIEFGYKLSTYYSKVNQNKRIIDNIKRNNKVLYNKIWIDSLRSNPLLNILGKDFYSKIISDKNLLSEIFLRPEPANLIMEILKIKKQFF